MEEVVLILGSNLNNKVKAIEEALQMLNASFKVLKISSKYKSRAWGYESENDFINVAVSIECSISPYDLLNKIIKIENRLGRVRDNKVRYSDRKIDIDIILFGDQLIKTPDLIIPHPRFHLRTFCLKPMKEIIPNKVVPGFKKTVSEIYAESKDNESVDCIYDEV